MELALEVVGVSKSFGGVQALSNVSFRLRKGKVGGLIGPNGAGKSTLLNVISGLIATSEGTVRTAGGDLLRTRPFERSRLGIGRTFQHVQLFPELSALENTMVGLHSRCRYGVLAAILHSARARSQERVMRERSRAALDRVGLSAVADTKVGALAYGSQKLVELARAIACGPEVLLLDEPAAGLNVAEKIELAKVLDSLRREGMSVLLIEHHVPLVMELCDRVTVLNHGSVIADGSPSEVRADPAVINAYLGRARATPRAER